MIDSEGAAVVEATKDHLAAVPALLGRSFEHDSTARYLVGDEAPGEKIAWLFGRLVEHALRHGCVHTTPRVQGVAAWLGPRCLRVGLAQALELGFAAAPLKLGLAPFARLLRYTARKRRLHAQTLAGPHWYLILLAVDPSAQGHGLGSALLRPQLDCADAQGLPSYLETGTASNLACFQKQGFVVSGCETLPGGPNVWGMLRPPHGAAGVTAVQAGR